MKLIRIDENDVPLLSSQVADMLSRLIPEDAEWAIREEIEIKRRLGSGGFATVHEASWKGSQVAAKKLHEIFFDEAVV